MSSTMPTFSFDFNFNFDSGSQHSSDPEWSENQNHIQKQNQWNDLFLCDPQSYAPPPPPPSSSLFYSPLSSQFSFSPINATTTSTTTTKTLSHYAHRYFTKASNPLSHMTNSRPRASQIPTSTSPSSRAKRRELYLDRVKRHRDEARFKEREEWIMRTDYVTERERWDETMRSDAESEALGSEFLDGVVEEWDREDEEKEYEEIFIDLLNSGQGETNWSSCQGEDREQEQVQDQEMDTSIG